MAVPGVRGVGVGRASDFGGADEPCVVVFADPGLARGALPATLEGLAVHVLATLGFVAQAGGPPEKPSTGG